MRHPPVCQNCQAVLDLSLKNPVQPVVYRHVNCRKCGTLCVLEGPDATVAYSRGVD
jgi:hypothetical protein